MLIYNKEDFLLCERVRSKIYWCSFILTGTRGAFFLRARYEYILLIKSIRYEIFATNSNKNFVAKLEFKYIYIYILIILIRDIKLEIKKKDSNPLQPNYLDIQSSFQTSLWVLEWTATTASGRYINIIEKYLNIRVEYWRRNYRRG